MKKFLKVFFIILAFLFVVILAIPFFFKADIMKLAKEEVNKNVKAQVDWNDVSISLFKGFPDLKVSLKEVSVIGIDVFEGDTLMAFDEFSVKVDLISAFSGKINIKSIILNRPVIRAIALKDGSVNWDITYPSDEEELIVEDTDTSSMDMQINLKEFLIKNASVAYNDEELGVEARIDKFNLTLTGNFSEDYTDLDLSTTSDEVTVVYDKVKYLNKAHFGFNALVGADMVNNKFTLNNNELLLNGLVLGLEGVFGMPNDTDYDVDLRFFSKETSFKTLLSMVPAMYMSDFEGLKASGTLSLEGTAKGLVTETALPKVNISLKVKDGHFSYPDLPKSADNIQVDLTAFYDGVYEDNSKLDLNHFHIEMAGNPIDAGFHVITPMSDMQMNGFIKGKIDLASLSDVIPLEGMSMGGLVEMNIDLMGRMSDIDNENYEAFKADGLFQVSNVLISGGDVPVPVKVEKVRMLFSPRFVNLENFDVQMGESDIHMNGRLENFIPYVFKDEVIKGNLNLTSSMLNINELMGEEVAEVAAEPEDTSVLTVVEVPANIDFILQTSLVKVIYDKLEIDNINGKLIVKDGIVKMDNLNMELLKGSMIMNGEYNTQDITTPMVDMDLAMNNIDIQSSFYAFNTVEQLAPVAESCRGQVSLDFKFTSFLDSTMNPDLNTLVGNGRLQTDEIKIENNETLDKIGKLIKKEDLKDSKFKDVDLSFEIRNGRVYIKPFDTKIGNSNLNVSGDQGIDQTLNYALKFKIPRSELGSSANDLIENLSAQANAKGLDIKPGDNINLQVNILGSFSDPKLSLNAKENSDAAKTQVKEAIKEKVTEEVEKVKEDIKEEYNAEIEKIMEDAENQAEQVKQAAVDAGVSLVGEAELRKKQLIKEAGSNPLKKLAAEKTGDELVKSANKQADKLKTEADLKAEAILQAARKKADDMKK
jgi:AsmA-like C-terminal region/AsmA family